MNKPNIFRKLRLLGFASIILSSTSCEKDEIIPHESKSQVVQPVGSSASSSQAANQFVLDGVNHNQAQILIDLPDSSHYSFLDTLGAPMIPYSGTGLLINSISLPSANDDFWVVIEFPGTSTAIFDESDPGVTLSFYDLNASTTAPLVSYNVIDFDLDITQYGQVGGLIAASYSANLTDFQGNALNVTSGSLQVVRNM